METIRQLKSLGMLLCMMTFFVPQLKAQEVDELQAYLDRLAAEQSQTVDGRRASVDVPVGLPEVNLANFPSYLSRTKTLEVKSSVKFINGTISASSAFTDGACLLKVMNGATVVLDATAAVDASAAYNGNCFAAVGIYGGSTFYECGDITAPDKGSDIAVYLDSSEDTFVYISGTLTGKISNPNNGTIIGIDVHTYTYDELKAKLDEAKVKLDELYETTSSLSTKFNKVRDRLSPKDLSQIAAKFAVIDTRIQELKKEYEALLAELDNTSTSAYPNLNTKIDSFVSKVNEEYAINSVDIVLLEEDIKSKLAADIQQKLTTLSDDLVAKHKEAQMLSDWCRDLQVQVGDYYFQRKSDTSFNGYLSKLYNDVLSTVKWYDEIIYSYYNPLIQNHSISSIEDAVYFYDQIDKMNSMKEENDKDLAAEEAQKPVLQELFDALDVNFPKEDAAYEIRPTGLASAIQMGYKSNRGFVLTSAGLMFFEQVQGATFRLKDANDNYIVATNGSETLKTGTMEEATIWTGRSLNNGSYTFEAATSPSWLAYSGTQVNTVVRTNTASHAWTIEESELDELQAFLNLLAEEDGAGSESGLTEDDELVINPPSFICYGCHSGVPFVFPRTIYKIRVTGGEFVVPNPSDGKRPADFHPIYIPSGSRIIFDDITFNDLVGGDHVIYVDGILEITINTKLNLENWEKFIHVGPTGRVIWHYDGDANPRIDNEGTLDMPEGRMGHLENTGTVNQTGGTIIKVVNRYIYYFTNGIINDLHNYGEYYHRGGTALTAYNYAGGKYTMTGGYVRNTIVNSTQTIFINYGTFDFTGGIIGGYGSRLIYHGEGGYMRIDGGTFDFSGIKDYFIEAHETFCIRGDYDYGSPLPILLKPSVTIRILYRWIYKFSIEFIGGHPTPRYPLFHGEDFTLTEDYYDYIDWLLPNHRWRWYLNVTDNTIEPRDEEVYDEDDLQAYLDWLAKYQSSEAASTESNPQVLDLGGRIIYITQPVYLPVGSHVYIKQGSFVPSGTWTYDYMFQTPMECTMRLEDVTIDLSSSVHYIVSGKPVTRYIFDITGNVYFLTGCHIKGYLDTSVNATDSYIPGAAFRIDPKAKVHIDGGLFDDVVFITNSVINIYVGSRLTGYIYIYVPSALRKAGYSFMTAYNSYRFVGTDVDYIKLLNIGEWEAEIGTDDNICLKEPEATAISNINANHDNVDVYTVNGTLVRKDIPLSLLGALLQKGVYIVNGKKIVIK
ncbi:MAG: hypothetical protein IJV38_12385 [Prevotella sp.]|nr:hypothetical protein [Prevotella sp.]